MEGRGPARESGLGFQELSRGAAHHAREEDGARERTRSSCATRSESRSPRARRERRLVIGPMLMVPLFRDLRAAGEIRASGSGASHDAHTKISRAG